MQTRRQRLHIEVLRGFGAGASGATAGCRGSLLSPDSQQSARVCISSAPPRAGRGARSSRCGVPGRPSRSGGRPGTRQRRDGWGGWGRKVFSSRVIDSLFAFYFYSCWSWICFAVGFSPFNSILSFRLRYYCTAIFQHTNPAVTMANISTIITICSLPAIVLFFTFEPFSFIGFFLT